MRLLILLAVVLVGVAAEELPLAEVCNEDLCQLPNCRCSSTNIPGGLQARDIPQFVTITFDDAVTAAAMPNYREILYNKQSSKGCPVGATFYVSHEWTDYSMINELYNNGFEMALHSISHQIPQSYWSQASYDDIVREIADQRGQLAHFANIPESHIGGVRLPFLQLSGNNSFSVIKDYNLGYDCTWTTVTYNNPPLWPYTLDYASIQDCQIPNCATASIPGVWVQPMVSWIDDGGFPCAMADACSIFPDRGDADAWFKFILRNFERHYKSNRAPFGFYIHEAYLRGWPAVKQAMIQFIDVINNLNDAFLVNSNEVLDWVKNPVPLPEYRAQPCKTWTPTTCLPSFCALTAEHNNWNYYMTVCRTCPRVYPWLGNPLGA